VAGDSLIPAARLADIADWHTEEQSAMFKNMFGKKDEDNLYRPRMPEVDLPPNIESVFVQARQTVAGRPNHPAQVRMIGS
jgi:hypothetical protein